MKHVKKYKDNKIVTHHAPSIHSINENFKNIKRYMPVT